MMSKLYLMMRCATEHGKSTWCKENLTDNDKYISRDEIRFNLIKEGEAYFSKEKEVFDTFINEINKNLKLGYNVYADATHLNPASRTKVINRLEERPEEINVIFKKISLETAWDRNENRTGLSYVPEEVIEKMYSGLLEVQDYEDIDHMYIIEN